MQKRIYDKIHGQFMVNSCSPKAFYFNTNDQKLSTNLFINY